MATTLVAGGGIGGLAAALSLAAHGHRVTVLERRDTFTELGAGIQLAPNAFHALDRLGVGEQVRGRAVFVEELRFMDGVTGERVASLPLTDRYQRRFGNPYVVVHRTDLYQPLLDACRQDSRIELCTDSEVVRYEQDGHEVRAVLADGRRHAGDALIGADGIRSAVRHQVVGDGEPRVSGHTIYRSVIPMDRVPAELRWNCVTLWAGPRWHFVHYPISGGRQLNLAITRDNGAVHAVTGLPVARHRVREEFPDLAPNARRLLELGAEWRRWVLCDRSPVGRWVDGRVALLGDAAHPMLQYAAQGAAMALEDAVLLGELLADVPDADLPLWLAEYNELRRARTAKAQLVSREMGTRLYHPAGVAVRERNAMLSGFSVDELFQKVEWLHGARDLVRA